MASDSSKHFDYIIIGAGSAGCLLANRLSADPTNSVLLIEAGGADNYPWIHIPIGYLYCIDNPRTDWRFRTAPQTGLNGRSLLYPRGKTLGGCSSINGMIYMRGQARDYDKWAKLTDDDSWCWNNVLPDFIRHEDHFSQDAEKSRQSAFHGKDGEWRVEEQRLQWEILDAFADASEQAGIPKINDFNTGDNFGTSYFQVNQRKGWRWNTAKAFLRPVMLRNNLTVATDTHVKRLLFDTGMASPKCIGVEVDAKGSNKQLCAGKEIILCAGAIGTPQILQLSGVGPKEVLDKFQIPVVRDSPSVGENLQDHLQIRAVFQVQGVPTLNKLAASWWGKFRIGLEYALHRSGPMSMAPSQLGVFTKSDPNQTHANLQFHVQPLSLDAFGQPLHSFPAFTASVCNLNPTSRGSVRIKSPDYRQSPEIAPNYLSTSVDKKVAADSLRVARHICEQSALKKYHPEEIKPGLEYQSDQELAARAGDIATTIFHPVGTAKMGRVDDPTAVVDAKLRVIGVGNLRIADASVMPTITSGNTNSPTMMIAEKAAGWILKEK